ncbi:MAG: hypothetical protein ACYC0P_10465 [Thiobacillus sp.]
MSHSPAKKPYRLSEPAKRHDTPGLLGRLIPLGFVIALGAYGYNEYTHRATPQTAHAVQSSVAATRVLFIAMAGNIAAKCVQEQKPSIS